MLTDDRDPVDVLAEEFADRLRRGEHPSVGDFAAAHPDHAAELRELLPAVAQMEMLKRFRHPSAEPSLPDRFGDFRIVRELGRGGMGVVFEAVQESLGRPVALKVLARHAQLDAKRRERFVREAQAAAKLHHTNIVPVFGVGEQDGLPYYVMQLIDGSGLHALVWRWRIEAGKEGGLNADETRAGHRDTKPAGQSGPGSGGGEVRAPGYGDWRFVAELAVQAANALHYAHRQGVLHRDVKPANLIYDGQTLWVADFGLAKLSDSNGLTATGDILGTLQYLPPECLAARADARSDVYGLGATLYELLTLEPPYASDSPARLIKQVADADPPAPRQISPAIPRDLETIVLKAMARRPEDRYATARDLAEDLEAFLEDRPIKARRTSPLARGWRWCRRNPAVASLALSTLVALSLAAVAGWVGYARAEERRKDAEEAKAKADRATDDAQQMAAKLEANLRLSLDTFEKVFEAASATNRQGFGLPLPPPVMSGPRRGPGGPKKDAPPGPGPGGPAAESASDKAAILEAVLNFYDKFAKQNNLKPELQFEAAKASRRVCEAHVWLGRPKEAGAAFRRAIGLLEPLVAQFPDNPDMRTELVMAYVVAPPEEYPGDPDAPLRRAAEVAVGDPWLAGMVELRRGFAREQAGDWPGAESAFRAAAGDLALAGPRPPHGEFDLAYARFRLAAALAERRKWPEARKVLEEAAGGFRTATGGDGNGPRPAREWLGLTYQALGDVCKQMGDTDAEKKARARAGEVRGRGPFGPGGPAGDFGPGGPKRDGPFGPWPFAGPDGKKGGPPSKKGGPRE
jgi:serine/threonine protein kinase